jgi:hypothetical protein
MLQYGSLLPWKPVILSVKCVQLHTHTLYYSISLSHQRLCIYKFFVMITALSVMCRFFFLGEGKAPF